MKEETLAILVVCALAFGGLGYLFTSLTSDVNQPIAADDSRVERIVVDQPAAPPATTLEQQGWHEIGGPSILANADFSEFLVNFNTCVSGGTTVDFPAGPLTLTLHGLSGTDCHLSYHLDDKDVGCEIPSSLGQIRFNATSTPNLSALERYCQAG
jgi:hypothetical protein